MKIIFGDLMFKSMDFNMSIGDMAEFAKNIFNTVKFAFNWLLAPYFWVLTYLRIKEKEVWYEI